MKEQILAGLGLTLVAGFGAMALVLAGPLTPITFDVGGVASILNPYFSQNWQLFAPDPISDERGVVARLQCSGGVTPWRDITSEAIARTQSTRFFPPRESRVVSNALTERFAEDDLTDRLRSKRKEDLAPEDEAAKRRAEQVLARYAALTATCGTGGASPSAVQLRYVTRSLPPWSMREASHHEAKPSTIDSGWIRL